MRRDRCLTRIVATVGPACDRPEALRRLLEAGVSAFRLNFSHGTPEAHAATIARIRAVEAESGIMVAILADLPGPKVRVRGLAAPVELRRGAEVRIGHGGGSSAGPPVRLDCTYADLVADVEPGQRVLIDDGAVRLLALERIAGPAGPELACAVIEGGTVLDRKGINLPDTEVRADPITPRDLAAIETIAVAEVDFVAMSFVQRRDDLERLRSALAAAWKARGRTDPPPAIVAKIERPAAVERIADILKACDAVMVARGDLGVEMDLAKVPIVQKRVLGAARAEGRPAIVATQMLQSMIESPVPTRAEVTDVANAILDGADAVMLSGETAMGRFAPLAVETLVKVAAEAEAFEASTARLARPPESVQPARAAVGALAVGLSAMAEALGVRHIAAWSPRGNTATYLSRHRYAAAILALGTEPTVLRRMRLLRAVDPVRLPRVPRDFTDLLELADAALREVGGARPGDLCLVATGEALPGTGEVTATLCTIASPPVAAAAGDGGGAA
jgi:pyruvate kinase